MLDRRALLSVGINAAPLASLRTGVARYIAGLLSGLAQVEEADLRWRALFAPPAVTLRRERLAEKAIRAARSVARRLPGSYFLAQALRGAALDRESRRGMSLYHETNNVAPPFGGTQSGTWFARGGMDFRYAKIALRSSSFMFT